MRLLEVSTARQVSTIRTRGVVERESTGERFEPYVEYGVERADFVGNAPDIFAAAMLIPAMRAGERLCVIPPISPRLCFSLPRIREIFHTWWPEFARIDLELTPDTRPHGPLPGRAATFFSGGVDSFYTLLKNRHGHGTLPAPLTHIIYMRGVETRLELMRDVSGTEAWIREIAAAAGVEPIVGESDFRTSLQGPEEYIHWERHYHGSALAAIALGLSPAFAFACIPSAFTYNHLIAHGSTPMVDEMFSTERLQIVHDGSEATRAVKTARLIEWDRDLVLKHLRVCILNRGGPTNCGQCKKCVRTAVPLYALGVWDQAATFPDKRTDHWEELIAQDHLALTLENLEFAREHGDARLVSLLTRAVRRNRLRERVKSAFEAPVLRPLRPAALRARDYFQRG